MAVIHVQHHLTISTPITLPGSIPVDACQDRRRITFSPLNRRGGRTFDCDMDDQDRVGSPIVCRDRTNPCKTASLTCAIREDIRP